MADRYADILLHISAQTDAGVYPVEAGLDDGSRFQGGEMRVDPEKLRSLELDVQAFGMELFYALFSGPIRRAYDTASGRAQAEADGRLRVRLWIDQGAAELHAIPWERLYHTHRGQDVPLATSGGTPFSRYTGLEVAEAQPITQQPLNLLFAVSNPTNLPEGLAEVPVVQEVETFLDALGDPIQNGQISVSLMPGRSELPEDLRTRLKHAGVRLLPGVASLENLLRALPEQHALHFLGHGAFRRRGEHGPGTAVLYTETEEGKFQITRDEELVSRLSALHTLPHLIFLAACESARRDPEHPFVGLGPKLVAAGVPAVVAMQDLVPITVARQLTADFYRGMLEEGIVDVALNQARLLLTEGESTDWAIPVLFMRLQDGRLFDFSAAAQQAPRLPFEPETVLVPAGPFLMGAQSDPEAPPEENPGHELTLPAFRMGSHPVTNRQYAAFLQQESGQEAPRKVGWFLRSPPEDRLDHPVVGVTWDDAQAYCRWLSEQTGRTYRLPTEAEWEKAARGTDGRQYPWGETWQKGACNHAGEETTALGQFPGGLSPYGCQDMAGNVQEWTSTLWGDQRSTGAFPYPYQARDGREDAEATHLTRVYRVHRGGSYQDEQAQLRCSARGRALSQSATRERGFRVMMELPQGN
jgi:formylglycine-generating enzyme required for sulfatase activity